MRTAALSLVMLAFGAAAWAGQPGGGARSGRPGGGGGAFGAPGGGAAPGAGEKSGADLKVEKCADSVILLDGTKLTGTIVAVGMKQLIMIEDGQAAERAIPRSEVESFRYGQSQGSSTAYKAEVDPDLGLPVISGEDDGTEAAPAPGPAPAPAPRPQPKANPKPNPAPAPGPGPNPNQGKADLTKLWGLLGGNAGAEAFKAEIAANPQWRREIGRLLRGEVPPEGAEAVARFKERLAKDPELRKAVEELSRRNRPPGAQGGAEGRPKGQ